LDGFGGDCGGNHKNLVLKFIFPFYKQELHCTWGKWLIRFHKFCKEICILKCHFQLTFLWKDLGDSSTNP
jgi:hypothetical protein